MENIVSISRECVRRESGLTGRFTTIITEDLLSSIHFGIWMMFERKFATVFKIIQSHQRDEYLSNEISAGINFESACEKFAVFFFIFFALNHINCMGVNEKEKECRTVSKDVRTMPNISYFHVYHSTA